MAFTQVNPKVVSAPVAPGREVLARRGAMLAYTGDVGFAPVHAGAGGVGGMAGRMLRGEQVAMMVAQGNGTVHYGYRGHYVTIIELDGSGPLSVEADRLVAHDAALQSTVVFLGQQGGIRGAVRGAVSGQGMFTTQLHGFGSVAVLSHGGTIALPVQPGRPTTVDPQAYVAHVGQVDADISVNASWRDAVGRGSGEAIQLKLTGTGTVYVQASEQKI
ncbi:AIM24 family protein [Pseudonocardia nigra]|uniref:AIM24 family protein n=1 Tax=Pseudonocardia nigra TaxID=1921578 RepID=UPI001C5DAF52|nr:AIM24 family protein [Pseudonocardia nigra]